MKEPIISVSGLRGIVGESLTPEVVLRYCGAYSQVAGPGPLVVTRDGRTTGAMVADLVRGGLRACGRTVLDGGVAATPTTGVLVRTNRAAGGIQISASHNPLPYNGLKLFSEQGRVIPAEAGEDVLRIYRDGAAAWVPHDGVGDVETLADTLSDHAGLVLALVDVERIRSAKFRVVLDSNHGAGSLLGARLLSELGCDVNLLGGDPDGRFAHPPEPTAENLKSVAAQVKNADVGFCQDPDADRLALIDESGKYVGEEYTLAVCLNHVLKTSPGPVVTNCATSRMNQDIAARYDVPCFRSAVGEANVADEMLRVEAVFGGEGNGGPIDPRVGYVRDSFVGMALVLDAMAASGESLSSLVSDLPSYAIHKDTVTVARDRIGAALEAIETHFAAPDISHQDGLRLDWPDRWLLVRASNTEPIVRTIAEATTLEEAKALCHEAQQVIK